MNAQWLFTFFSLLINSFRINIFQWTYYIYRLYCFNSSSSVPLTLSIWRNNNSLCRSCCWITSYTKKVEILFGCQLYMVTEDITMLDGGHENSVIGRNFIHRSYSYKSCILVCRAYLQSADISFPSQIVLSYELPKSTETLCRTCWNHSGICCVPHHDMNEQTTSI